MDALTCTATPVECLRERCFDAKCPHRPQPAKDEEDDGAVDVELPVDDLDKGREDDELDTEEQDDDQEAEAAIDVLRTEASGESSGKKLTRNMHVVAKPVSHYMMLFNEVVAAAHATHILVLTRTSHPSALVAGRALEKETICLVRGPSQHSLKHGEALLMRI